MAVAQARNVAKLCCCTTLLLYNCCCYLEFPHHGHDGRRPRVAGAPVQPHLAVATLEPQHLQAQIQSTSRLQRWPSAYHQHRQICRERGRTPGNEVVRPRVKPSQPWCLPAPLPRCPTAAPISRPTGSTRPPHLVKVLPAGRFERVFEHLHLLDDHKVVVVRCQAQHQAVLPVEGDLAGLPGEATQNRGHLWTWVSRLDNKHKSVWGR